MKRKSSVFSILLLLLLGFATTLKSQTTLTTTFANNNGFSLVTMNFTNNNPSAVIITDIASICGAGGSQAVAAFYKASAINGAPGAIDVANGWNQFGSATITGIANTTTTVTQPFMSGLSLIVPAGATYGIAVQATSLRYSTVAAGTYTSTGGGAVLTSGSNVSYAGDVAPNAPTFTPRGFIGSITFTGAVPCSGTPAPGGTISTANPVCPTVPFTLSTQNPTAGSGVLYQWQSSPDGTAWTNIGGATNPTFTTSQTVATWYRANVTCAGNTTASTGLQVTINTPSNCYCAAGATDVTFEKISNVAFGTINNPSTSTGGYENFTNLTTTVIRQSTTPITVTISNPFAADVVLVWIDLNQNGSFTDAGELRYTSPAGVGPHTGNITIPVTASLGSTRMRVRMHDSSLGPNATPCGNSTYGQVEDYTVNIVPCVQGVFTTQPASGSISCAGTRTFSVAATGSALTFTWQQRTSATAPWTAVTNGGIFSGATTANLVLTNVPSSYNGYQYRAVMDGPCTATEFSSPATLTITPLTAQVVPTSATICAGTVQALNIVNPGGFGTPVTTTISSGPISVPIPDNNPAGAISTLTSNTPLGAVITALSVTFTLPHTYSGDMIMVLRAPGGQILNLNYFLTATGNPGNGYLNTIIGSAGTQALGTGTPPFTGLFRADGQLTAPFGPTGPTGYAATVGTFAGLYPSQANGTWTLAMYDGGALDVGTLTSWSLTMTYTPIAPLSGTWTSSPATPNTIFNDVALTSPYVPGTPTTGVYVNPSTQGVTNYIVSVISPTCTIAPFTIPVTVNTPVGTVPAPANSAVCENGNTTFTVAPTSGGAFTYQWQVSTDGGGTWANIANGNIYNGVTTATLSITGAPLGWNNYQYRAVVTVPSCNSANSGAATLTVNQLPDVVINAGPYTNLYPGITTTLTAAVSPNAAATYQWYKNGQPVPGATNATLVVDVDNLGDYYVSVNDVNACGNISNTITIGSAPNDIMFIYPSPSTGQFQVRYYNTPGNAVARTLTIYDSKGSRVFFRTYSVNTPYNQMDVDLKHHGHGIYRVELGDLNGKRIKTGSVLIL